MTKKINGLYRAKVNSGKFDTNYRHNDNVKFIKYTGKSMHGDCRIKYDLVDFLGKTISKGNTFKTCNIDWNVRYEIKKITR